MAEILVQLPGGEGVVRRDDGEIVVTHDVSDNLGQRVRDRGCEPVKTWHLDDRSVVGGLLPDGAVSAEVLDDRGTRISAQVGGGAYVAILDQPNDGLGPVVCCRDETGVVVRRQLGGDYMSTPVDDAEPPCPACGGIDYVECLPTESWRGGRPGPNHTTIPTPIVVCRNCGHEEPEGVFFFLAATTDDEEDKAAREARIARQLVHDRWQRWQTNAMTLRSVTFAIYAANGWLADIGASSSRADHITSLTLRHYATADADPDGGDRPILEISTANDPASPGTELHEARSKLESWLENDGTLSQWPQASQAAITLWHAARQRAVRARVLNAAQSEQLITIDGTPQRFLTLSTPAGRWVAVRRHAGLTITVAAHHLDATAITVARIPDPLVSILGPEPAPRPRSDDPGCQTNAVLTNGSGFSELC